MIKSNKLLTPKQKQLQIRKRLLISFRRFIALEGDGDAVRDYLDLNAFELRNHIESQMSNGMTWDNYKIDWCIDHIVPIKYFDVFSHLDMKLCWNHHNLKPSWNLDNHSKGSCIEVAMAVLLSMRRNVIVNMLIDKIDGIKNTFNPYYKN